MLTHLCAVYVSSAYCAFPLSAARLNLLPNFQKEKGGLTGSQFLEGLLGKNGVAAFT